MLSLGDWPAIITAALLGALAVWLVQRIGNYFARRDFDDDDRDWWDL